MRTNRFAITCVCSVLLASLYVASCSSKQQTSTQVKRDSHIAIARGFKKIQSEMLKSGFKIDSVDMFSGSSRLFAINGEPIQIIEYETPELAKKDASRINHNGSEIGNAQVDWSKPPYFYLKDNMIVIFTGDNAKVISKLEEILGKPIAHPLNTNKLQ